MPARNKSNRKHLCERNEQKQNKRNFDADKLFTLNNATGFSEQKRQVKTRRGIIKTIKWSTRFPLFNFSAAPHPAASQPPILFAALLNFLR